MTEEELYEGLVRHDEAVYHWAMGTYSKLLWAQAAAILPKYSAMEIEEVVSDVFIRLWQNPEKFNPERGSLKSYLALMARSIALNKYKQQQKKFTVSISQAEEVSVTELDKEDWEELYRGIQMLEEPFKEIIIRRFFYEEKPQEIRKKMRLSAKEVDNFLYRGKKKLRKILGERAYLKEV